MKPFSVIIVAAGRGERLGGEKPKQFLELSGKTLLQRNIDFFRRFNSLIELCVVINPEHRHYVSVQDEVILCDGGKTRQQSVHNGLKSLQLTEDSDIVFIHDAARPFVRETDVGSLLNAMDEHLAATLAVPVRDTLRYKNGLSVERENLWSVQTPQAFRYDVIVNAHRNNDEKHIYSDDTGLLIAQEVHVEYVHSGLHNFKITYPEDLVMARQLTEQYETRTGMGFDVHAFDKDTQTEFIRLCGVDIPYHQKLRGHSDADVVLHTLTDAILGAIGQGDIGQHFPPSDNAFKDMDSAIFLQDAMDRLNDANGKLINVDLTIICEAPKIGPHRDTMIDRLSKLLGISKIRINIKATTTEQLGFTGRKEGIAAQAVVTVKLPAPDDEMDA